MLVSCTGLCVGVPLAFWGKRFAASLVQDLPNIGALSVIFGATAMIAVAHSRLTLPARRGARVDPMEALRHE